MDVRKLAEAHLSKRLAGENPENDSSEWSLRAAKGMDVFRDAIRDTLASLSMGHMSIVSAVELIEICGRGIDAFILLDDGDIPKTPDVHVSPAAVPESGNRELWKVLDEIMIVLPANHLALRADLKRVRESAKFAAPEIMSQFWYKAADALAMHIPEPSADWELKALEIFTGKTA